MKIPERYEGPVVAAAVGLCTFVLLSFVKLVAWLT